MKKARIMPLLLLFLVGVVLLASCRKEMLPSEGTGEASLKETTFQTEETDETAETEETEETGETEETDETAETEETEETKETAETAETEETEETAETSSDEPVFIVSFGDTANASGIKTPEIWIDEEGHLFIKVGFVNKTSEDVYLNDYRTLWYREDSRWVTCSLAEEAEISDVVTRVGLGSDWSEIYELTGVFDLSRPGAYRFSKDPFLWVEFKLTEGIGDGAESDTGSRDEAPTTQAPGDLEFLADIPKADESIVGEKQTIRLSDYYFLYLYNAKTGEERLAVSHRGLCDSPTSYSTMTVYSVKLGGLEGLKAACLGEVSGTVLATAGIGRLDGFYYGNSVFYDYQIDPREVFYASSETKKNPNALQFYFGGYNDFREDVVIKGNMTAEPSQALRRDYDYARRVYFERFGLLKALDILSLNFGLADYVTWS